MTFTVSTTKIGGEDRIRITTHAGVRYDVRTKEAAIEIIDGLLSGSRAANAEAAPKFAPAAKPSAEDMAKYGAWADAL